MKKLFIPAVAAFMAVVFSAFSLPKKTVAKDARTVDYYWYIVDLSTDQIPQNATYVLHDSKEDTEVEFAELCPDGTQRDCMRGFTNSLNTSSGPVSTQGDSEIKTNREP
jgi:hypothetical protein